MAHTRVKYTKGGRFEHEDLREDSGMKGWHLMAEIGDGEFTACGNSIIDYDHISEVKQKGGITCKNCLETIRYYKEINL